MLTSWRRELCGSVLLGVLASVAVGQGLPNTPEATEVKDLAGFFPHRQWHPLPGKVTGVLASENTNLLREEGRRSLPGSFAFGTGNDSYRWLYVTVDQKPLIGAMKMPINDRGETRQFSRLSLANPETVKARGITQPFTLVEVEVNGGSGSPAQEIFVATSIRPVEGSKEYSFRTTELVTRFQQEFAQHCKREARAIEELLRTTQKAALGERPATGPREETPFVYVTWLPEQERLRVRLKNRISNGAYETVDRTLPATTTLSGRKITFQPKPVRFGTTFGVELGMAFEVSKSGQLVKKEILPLQAFQREIAPPPAKKASKNNRNAAGSSSPQTAE